MKQCGKRLLGLLLAAALCLTVNVKGYAVGLDDAWEDYGYETEHFPSENEGDVPVYLPDEYVPEEHDPVLGTEPEFSSLEEWEAYYNQGEQDGIAVYAADDVDVLSEDSSTSKSYEYGYYSVTIPKEVTLSDADQSSTLKIEGKIYPYRTLTIDISSKNDYQLKYASQSSSAQELGYTLDYESAKISEANGESGQQATCKWDENKKQLTVDTYWVDSVKITSGIVPFSAEYEVKLNDAAAATVSGTYTDALTFTMSCTKKTYNIIYNGNDGTAEQNGQSVNNVSVTYNCGEYAALPANPVFTNEGYYFAGWATTKDANDAEIFKPGVPLTTVFKKENWAVSIIEPGGTESLYAQWKKATSKYTVTVELYDQTDKSDKMETTTLNLPAGLTMQWNGETLEQLGLLNGTKASDWAGTTCITPPDKNNFTVKMHRDMAYLDINTIEYDPETGVYKYYSSGGYQLEATIYINENLYPLEEGKGIESVMQQFRCGSTYRIEISGLKQYYADEFKLLGYYGGWRDEVDQSDFGSSYTKFSEEELAKNPIVIKGTISGENVIPADGPNDYRGCKYNVVDFVLEKCVETQTVSEDEVTVDDDATTTPADDAELDDTPAEDATDDAPKNSDSTTPSDDTDDTLDDVDTDDTTKTPEDELDSEDAAEEAGEDIDEVGNLTLTGPASEPLFDADFGVDADE